MRDRHVAAVSTNGQTLDGLRWNQLPHDMEPKRAEQTRTMN